MSKTKVGFISLGCSKNQIDTEIMLHHVMEAGYEITAEDIEADIMIINTCGFIESAKREAIDNILDAAWLKKGGSHGDRNESGFVRRLKGIIVTGCMAERYREEILSDMPEVDAVIGVGSIHKIVDAVKAVENGMRYTSFEDKNALALGGERILTTPEYMAYLKVAEGCDNCCTYCAIPLIRGSFRSRPMEDIVAEAKDLEELGVKELIVIAQDTTRYGLDLYGEYRLAQLLREITQNTSIPWIRILYCYPDKITDELIGEIKNNDRILKYVELPVQHISDPILKKMNRRGTGAQIRDVIARLRREIPNVILRTTAIVGFPGETEEDFEQLCNFIKETRFDRFGAFTYSPEEGTAAAEMENQIDEQEKQNRYDTLMQIQLDITEQNNKKLLNKTFQVLCEGFDPVAESYFGRSYMDAPEIDGKIYFTSKKKVAEGEFVSVRIKEVLDYDLVGVLV